MLRDSLKVRHALGDDAAKPDEQEVYARLVKVAGSVGDPFSTSRQRLTSIRLRADNIVRCVVLDAQQRLEAADTMLGFACKRTRVPDTDAGCHRSWRLALQTSCAVTSGGH